MACEPSKTYGDLANICAIQVSPRVTFNLFDRFKNAIYRIKPQGLTAILSGIWPRRSPEARLFSMQRGNFPSIVFIWARDSPWASIEVFLGLYNSAEGEREWCFSSHGYHTLLLIHLPYLVHQVFTSAGTKTSSGSFVLFRCWHNQQSHWLVSVARVS